MSDPTFALTDHERQSTTWKKIKAHYEAKLASLRAKNDQPQSDESTEHLRGRIAEVKAFLKIEKSE